MPPRHPVARPCPAAPPAYSLPVMSEGAHGRTDGTPAPCAVAVMAKASAPGRTKTRLVPPLTFAEAADLNTAFLQDIAASLTGAADAGIAPFMAFGPPGSEGFFAEHLPGVGLIETWLGDFGDCLFHAVTTLLGRGHASACVLNADSPTLPRGVLAELAAELARPGDRAVIGPADDGGYYVLGLKAAHRALFDGIAWSTAAVFDQTLAKAAAIGLPVHVLPRWYDVDDAASLTRLCRDVFDPVPAGGITPGEAPHSRALLTTMFAHADLAARLAAA